MTNNKDEQVLYYPTNLFDYMEYLADRYSGFLYLEKDEVFMSDGFVGRYTPVLMWKHNGHICIASDGETVFQTLEDLTNAKSNPMFYNRTKPSIMAWFSDDTHIIKPYEYYDFDSILYNAVNELGSRRNNG